MPSWFSYSLIEGSGPDGGGQRRWEEWMQPFHAGVRAVDGWIKPWRRKQVGATEGDLDQEGYPLAKWQQEQQQGDGEKTEIPARWAKTARWGLISSLIGIVLVAAGIYFMSSSDESEPDRGVLKYVDPLIGTGRGGHVFAGATLPFGMAKAVADVTGEKQGGFAWDHSPVSGFSHLHDSGTGGSPSMGNFPIFAHRNCENDDPAKCPFNKMYRASRYIGPSVKASAGYFSVDLENHVRAEMTTSFHAVLYKFTFLPDENNTAPRPLILVDTTDLPNTGGQRSAWIDHDTGRMTANGSFSPSFGVGMYNAYFCADFKGAKIRNTGFLDEGGRWPEYNITMKPGRTKPSEVGVFARFKQIKPKDSIMVRVGMSFKSIDKACKNAENEISDWDFQRLQRESEKAWAKKLAPIQVDSTGVSDTNLKSFWSGIYRSFISPQDYTGENQLWESDEPYYDSWYCIWDTFRGVHPFLTLVDPVEQGKMVRALLDIYKHEKWLPDCRMSFCKGFTQGGSNADVVVVDAFLKKLPDVNWTLAYEAIVKDAEVQPRNWDRQGRGGLEPWKTIGYIPYLHNDKGNGLRTRSVSRTVEYAYNDFCIAQMANATDRGADFKKYAGRADNWKNVLKHDMKSMGFKGFVQPRFENGTWAFQNATLCSELNQFDSCYLNPSGHETYEGSPWLYTFYVPHDNAALIKELGGPESFVKRVDKLHESGVLYMGDEQSFLTAYLYHYAGRPGLSARRSHYYIPKLFNSTRTGLPGNDDSGAMGTYVFFNMIGIFPSAGQNVYFITPPYFKTVSIRNPDTGKVATIKNINFDPSYKAIYIQSVKVNGKAWTKNWIDHSFFADGGTMELTLGTKESAWGTKAEDLPPSLSTGIFL